MSISNGCDAAHPPPLPPKKSASVTSLKLPYKSEEKHESQARRSDECGLGLPQPPVPDRSRFDFSKARNTILNVHKTTSKSNLTSSIDERALKHQQVIIQASAHDRNEDIPLVWPAIHETSKHLVSGASNLATRKVTSLSKPVTAATIVEVVRNGKAASKGYTYVLAVTFANTKTAAPHIGRTFDDFFEMHLQLLGHFPDAGGVEAAILQKTQTAARILPFIPVQMMHVTESVAIARIRELQTYIDV